MTSGSIVLSLAGRDKGRLHMVKAHNGEFAEIADGKWRKIQTPKRKKLKHLRSMPEFGAFDINITNRELRKIIAECKAKSEQEGECV